jgi:asparagine synthase (glutamine-hydrolysing)
MCGITGFVSPPAAADELTRAVRGMCGELVHRGPDDAGEWIDAAHGVAIGFRRLAIIDLSPAGHQPMISASGRYVATLNGEIYNFEELRRELRERGLAPEFRGHSDTEVMLAAFDAWGIDAVARFNGMFAIAVWDTVERRLHLVRDRMGVKPVYYGFAGDTFVYGSELKALRRHPGFDPRIDRNALRLYLRFLYVPAPFSIYEGISKAMPGTIVTLDPDARMTRTTVYWSARDAAIAGTRNRFAGTEDEASQELEALLRDAVRIRMVADVPIGVFLSGGVDSSLVTALMQAESATPVKSFSIGFDDLGFNEAPYAAAVARHLGTEHTELMVHERDALDVIPRLAAMYDEPFADSSQIPTHLVSALARRHVTVSLSGDGGDELFGGYTRYFVGQRLFRWIARTPRGVRPTLGRALGKISTRTYDRLRPRLGERAHKVARVLKANDVDAMYFELVSHWPDAARAPVENRDEWPPLDDPIERMMYFDQISYLPDDILTKVDRASMAASLESREPLLDYRLVELAWRLPLSMKVRGGQGKRVLRRVLYRYVPEELIERPKMGFGIPLGAWLRGPLREWAEPLLSEAALRKHGLLDPAPIRAKWDEHLSGRYDWNFYLWGVLMLQVWLDAGA